MNKSIENIDPYKDLLTRHDVETIVEKSVGCNDIVFSYFMVPYSDSILGFLSDQKELIVHASSRTRISGTYDHHTYFLKCVPYSSESQAKLIQESNFFEKETTFYNLIIPELMKNSKDKSWVAQCYLAKKDVLVFEKLQNKYYGIKNNFLDYASLKAALSSMAKMHAASLLAEKQVGKSFLELYPHLLNEVPFGEKGPFAGWFQAGMNLSTAIVKKLGLDDTSVSRAYNLAREKMKPSTTRQNVLCHGDANVRNLMFNFRSECALVDFQMFIYAPAMVDVAQLIYLNSSEEVRDEYEANLLRHYYKALGSALEGGGVDLPTFDHVVDEYNEMRIVGIVTANLYFPIDFLDNQLLTETVKNFESSDGIYSQNHEQVVFNYMDEREYCRKLMRYIAQELVDALKMEYK